MLTAVLVVFGIGGAISALATDVTILIGGRAVQGVAGGVFPLAFGIVRDALPRAKVPGAIGAMSAVYGIGAGIGLLLSGVVLDRLDTSWLFWLSVLALPVALAAHRCPPQQGRARGLVGAAVLALALVSVVLAVSQAPQRGWASPATVALAATGMVLLVAWVRLETRVPSPLDAGRHGGGAGDLQLADVP